MSDSALEAAKRALPKFSDIDPSQLVDGITAMIDHNRKAIDDMFDNNETSSWSTVIQPLEDLGDALARYWAPFAHLHNVADTPALREAYNAALPLLSEYANEYAQDKRIYVAHKRIHDDERQFEALSGAQQKVLDNALRDFKLSGIALEEDQQTRLREIRLELTKLGTTFEQNVLDATQSWKKHIDDVSALAGLPPSAVALAQQNAENDQKTGWLLTLDFPCYMPVITYAEDRALRQEVYQAYVTRSSDLGPSAGQFDNSDAIDSILRLRSELADVLGFANYAEYSLATKMAESNQQVLSFLADLAERARPSANAELAQLQAFAAENLGLDQLEAWDLAFVSEKLKQHLFDVSQEELRPYFPIDKVIDGMFTIVNRLFGISISPINDVETWHDDVGVFEVRDGRGELRGLFYTDLYAREYKRGGAWMDDCVGRRRIGETLQYPVAFLTCNFTPPLGDAPSTLTHNEVLTLFHEFGHGLHHMLTLVDEGAVAGINGVPWDGVELPSQFLENWCWEDEALTLISAHVDSGETIPAALIEKMYAAKNFQAAMQMLRQIEFALFDFRLHAEYHAGLSVQHLLDDVRAEVSVFAPPSYNRFQHSFSHIFAGGYAAGYYSYKWAEVLSADAYARFEQDGVFNGNTGREFMESILERGGAVDTMACFTDFRGRPPEIEPLLRHAGLLS